MKMHQLTLALCLGFPFFAAAAPDYNATQYVNPLIGTAPADPALRSGPKAAAGNTYPGAVCPHGMVAWSPDTTQIARNAGGYAYYDPTILDFSLTHFSGRAVMYLMDFPFMPVVQPVTTAPDDDWTPFAATYSHANEVAVPGYYRVKLDNGIVTELTATARTGMARFTFPASSFSGLLIHASSINSDSGSISIKGNEVTGSCNDTIGGKQRAFKIYFIAEFDRPFQSAKTWLGNAIGDHNSSGNNCGAILTFDTATNPVVQARVGISFVSLKNARKNLKRENPGWDFDAVRHAADALWNRELGRIQVEGGTISEKQSFYTSLYHSYIHPTLLDDVNGQYPGMDGKIHRVRSRHHQYQNITAWDQYRSLAPLISLLSPDEVSDIAQSLVNYAQQDAAARPNGGGLPRWEQVNRNSAGMVGDGDDAIIASAFAFGANHFKTERALAAMDKGASQPGTTSDGFEVRRGLKDYLTLGYVPGAVSVTLEYCNDDFALAQYAKALGDPQKSIEYQNRAQNWEKLFDDSTGLLRPRDADGAWFDDFSPTAKKGFVEGTPVQYVWMVNFNLGGLIEKMGGNEKAVARLDKFFTNLNSGFGGATAYMGNEPCEETPWVYDFAGAPAHTQKVVRRIQSELFVAEPRGIPGNDDAGALSSWNVFSQLGLYPEIPGIAGFVIGSPVFAKTAIYLENGATIQINGHNAGPDNCYVQSLKLNGQDYPRLWLPWSALSHGATLDFDLSGKPSAWGSGPDAAPPSYDAVKQ